MCTPYIICLHYFQFLLSVFNVSIYNGSCRLTSLLLHASVVDSTLSLFLVRLIDLYFLFLFVPSIFWTATHCPPYQVLFSQSFFLQTYPFPTKLSSNPFTSSLPLLTLFPLTRPPSYSPSLLPFLPLTLPPSCPPSLLPSPVFPFLPSPPY